MSAQNNRPGIDTEATIKAFRGAETSIAPASRCARCGRTLSSLPSIARGFGRVCFDRTRRAELAELLASTHRLIEQLAEAIDRLGADRLRVVHAMLTDALDGGDPR